MSFEPYRRVLTPIVRTIYRVEVRGGEHVPRAGSLVVVANHDSVLDPFLLMAAIPRPMHYLGKAELWRVPVLRWWLDSIGAIRLERGRSDQQAIASAIDVLEEGEVIGIFPEGAVRHDTPWLRGAARMALAAGAPILPVKLLGTREAIGRDTVSFPRLAALIGEPIAVERAVPTPEAATQLTDVVRAAVEALGT